MKKDGSKAKKNVFNLRLVQALGMLEYIEGINRPNKINEARAIHSDLVIR